ncbi:polysaccharide biosynthesis/export family protein [Frigidibacter sp. RF13]|uniref:polysaccharide biosynthesis/export family protein n=1 Tax=Frigidibacter sp. RF13 TaxID=2997340 RepID=UPI00227049E6|nr:polysaccharide biosynthesis/export family protein [Frigidibacter sp. RF13]MCY1126043.1 polysaccharide biosynthesis/export family protein [Frigidibacter sp. RF13]
MVALVAACGLPRSGPNKKEILAGSVEQNGNSFIIPVDARVARLTGEEAPIGFPAAFRHAGLVGSDEVRPGDKLGVTIWENVENGLLAKAGASATPLQEIQVDGQGFIFVPYAGRVKASGNSVEELRRIITEKLAEQTPDPQVEVTRLAGDGATVSVIGDIGGQGVYPIERPTRSLSAMIARAGGVAVDPQAAQVTVTRGKSSGKARLVDIYENPAMDIALRPGDVILVEADPRSFTAMGATGAQSRVQFETPTLTAIEALAQVGGLSTNFADPKGVFVLRDESEAIARAVLGRNDLKGPQRVAYVLNLTEPDGLFNARDFLIRDGDTLYVTEAPYVQWQKTLAVLTGTASSASSVNSLAQGN